MEPPGSKKTQKSEKKVWQKISEKISKREKKWEKKKLKSESSELPQILDLEGNVFALHATCLQTLNPKP